MGEYYKNAYRLFLESMRREAGNITNPSATCISMCSNKEYLNRNHKIKDGKYILSMSFPNKVDLVHQSKIVRFTSLKDLEMI